jgi:MFS transporter, DHA1 family, multidrug resistance protein
MKKIFPVLALAMFSSTLGMGIIMPFLPGYAQNMGASGVWIGAIISGYGIASIFSTPLFGRLSDRKGRKILLCIGLLGYAIISIGYIFSSEFYQLILVRMLHGAAGGMVLPIASAYIGDISPKNEEGKWMGYANAAFFGGFGAGPLVGGAIAQYLGIHSIFYFMGGLNLLAMLIVLRFLPRIDARPTRTEAKPSISFRVIFRSNKVKGLIYFQLTQAFARGAFFTFLPLFAATRGSSPALIGILLSVSSALMSVLGPIGGFLADRYSRRMLANIGSVMVILVMVLVPFAGNFGILLILCALYAAAGAIGMSAGSAMSVQEGRKFGMGTTMGLITTGMNIGFAMGPILSGEIVDLSGINSAFYLGAIIVIIGIGLFSWYTRKSMNREETSF